MPNINMFGNALLGIAQGFDNYQKTQSDLDYLRQSRAQQLVANDQANQLNQLKIAQEQQQVQLADDVNNYARRSLAPDDGSAGNALAGTDRTPTQQGQAIAGQTAPNAPRGNTVANPFQGGSQGQPAQGPAGGTNTGTGVQAGKSTSGLKTGAYNVDQYAAWDKQFGFKPGTAYALIMAESGGDPNAVSPTGAVGPTQVLPSTAANPGFGIKPGNPRDPEFGLGYFKKMLDLADGNYDIARSYYLNGPNAKSPDAPGTHTYLARQHQFESQFNAGSTAQQSQSAPTPADRVDQAESAGVTMTPVSMGQAVDAQSRMIASYDRAAMQAARDGNMQAAQVLAAKAEAMRGQQLDLSEKRNRVQKDANEQVSKLAVGVVDQPSYNNLISNIAQNPAMQAAVAGLNLSGNFEADRNKLATLASRTLTLTDQADLQFRTDDQRIKDAKERREQEQYDRQRMQEVQQRDAAARADAQRRDDAARQGVPYVPSFASSAPPGTTPQEIAKARQENQKTWQTFDKDTSTQRAGVQQKAQLSSSIYNLVANGGDGFTGGWFNAGKNSLPEKVVPATLSDRQQEFFKQANQLVLAVQASAPPGAQRSAATAAMAGIIQTTKPNLSLSPQANMAIASDLYYGAQSDVEMYKWLDSARRLNPDASPQDLMLQWREYENSIGPAQIYDPKDGKMHINSATVPTLPNGQPNPDYQSPYEYFAHKGAK
ncbi:Transglycosylase SLT domain protein [Caballeronia pedi]|uniref:Transglycosylase SLT domain protein n=1 Tax=Caballeronia pedi TaxID=1777141 RepID=A0A158DGZ8_9BURK|nr:transglycosylase SLT domain-containing protein [Caballeronia pedi]SAK93912.1 Transglycosylase SLT domain protein [Caballeronia pedi]